MKTQMWNVGYSNIGFYDFYHIDIVNDYKHLESYGHTCVLNFDYNVQ